MIQVTCAIIVQNNKILITQRGANSSHPFKWEFPGGKIEELETDIECIKREIREELNVEIEILKNLNSVHHNYTENEIKLIPFLCGILEGDIKLNEHNDCAWKFLDELKNVDFSEADSKILQNPQNYKILQEYTGK